eukprot:m.68200 g.68200  ORF g.68200 m.68200 type:complete len:234 (+) comp35499_c0_seq1:308-1009(+)
MFLLASLIAFAVSLGVCGITVSNCKSTGSNLQVVYVMSYSLVGVGTALSFMTVADCSSAWMHRQSSRISSAFTVGMVIGSIVHSQFFLKLQRLYESGVLHAETIFFLIAILFVVSQVPLLIFVKHPVKSLGQTLQTKMQANSNGSHSGKRLITTATFWIFAVLRFLSLAPGLALADRQQPLFETKSSSQPPIELLSFLAQFLFLVGPFLVFPIADRLGPMHLWILAVAFRLSV